MKSRLLALIAFLSIFSFSSVSAAKNVCFYILWDASKEGDHIGVQKPGKQYFVKLNGAESVGFEKVEGSEWYSSGKTVASKSEGCIDSGRFKLGTNHINFSFILGNGSVAIYEGHLKIALWMKFPNGSSRTLMQHMFEADPNRTHWELNEKFTVSIEEVDPEAAAYVRSLKDQVSNEVLDYKKARETFASEKIMLEQIIASIEKKDFDEITDQDLQDYLEAKEKLRVFKENAQGKRQEIEIKKGELKAAVAEVKKKVEDDLIAEGYDFTSDDFFQIPVDYSLVLDEGQASGSNPFDSWAEHTVEDLKYLIGNEQRLQFLEKVRFWTVQAESFIETVRLRANTSVLPRSSMSKKFPI